MIESMSDPHIWGALAALVTLEIVLGVDNIVFIAIMAGRLRPEQRPLAYRLGLGGALVMRLALLSVIWLIMKLEADLFTVLGEGVSGKDLILIVGGIFLIGKASHEIFHNVEGHGQGEREADRPVAGLWGTVGQIMLIDIIFSLDSVITAVGIGEELWVMATAMIIAVLVMLFAARPIGEFVERHLSMKLLALSFLLLIGVLLVADGLGQHISKGYVYFAMAFAFLVELLNLRLRTRAAPGAPPHP